jgi:heme/copper-type cytochrome/quinol oxidase subunit 4
MEMYYKNTKHMNRTLLWTGLIAIEIFVILTVIATVIYMEAGWLSKSMMILFLTTCGLMIGIPMGYAIHDISKDLHQFETCKKTE